MIESGTAAERVLRESALAEAEELFAHHGAAAIELLIARIHDPALSPVERRRYRLARLEAERLVRDGRDTWSPNMRTVTRPRLLSWRGIKRLFGRKSRGTTRRNGR